MQLLSYLISQKFISLRDSKVFRGIVIIIIVISAIYAGLSTYDLPPTVINAFSSVDYFITIFFSIEIIIRIIAERSIFVFLKKGWNIFDFLVVIISLIPIQGSESIFILRLLRIARLLRIIVIVPAFRRIIRTFFSVLPRVGFISLLMFIFFYIYGIIGTILFENISPQRWDDIGTSMLTLLQVATFDDWGNIMHELIPYYPWCWVYFVSFIIIIGFILMNMVIGTIVDLMRTDKNIFGV